MAMRPVNTRPLPLRRRLRREEWRGKTSGRAGVVLPLAYFALLREEAISGNISVQVVTTEAVRPVANPINMRVQVWLVPHSALERFNGSMETFNRSFMGQKMPDGTVAPTLFSQRVMSAPDPVLQKLGLHVKNGVSYNFDLTRSYNVLCNWRKTSTSELLATVAEDSLGLSRSFWLNENYDYIKPSFDAAAMEGEVALNLNGAARVSGLGIETGYGTVGTHTVRDSIGQRIVTSWLSALGAGATAGEALVSVEQDPDKPGYPLVQAELANVGATISLANIDMARKLTAFAALRDRYAGVKDDYLVDLMMMGVNIPEADLENPILLGEVMTQVGLNERWATDGNSLDVSVSNGFGAVNLRISTPPINTGGVVMVIAEVMPEPLYERVKDAYLFQPAAGDLPDYRTDEFDPQKVAVVKNEFMDVLHNNPTGIFGYAPLNYQWQRNQARVGGKFMRRQDDRFVEDRQTLWTVDIKNPQLGNDFYLAPNNLPHTVFADQTVDPFEFTVYAPMTVSTHTVFGPVFDENFGSYEAVMEDVDTSRIQQPAPTVQPVKTTEKE